MLIFDLTQEWNDHISQLRRMARGGKVLAKPKQVDKKNLRATKRPTEANDTVSSQTGETKFLMRLCGRMPFLVKQVH